MTVRCFQTTVTMQDTEQSLRGLCAVAQKAEEPAFAIDCEPACSVEIAEHVVGRFPSWISLSKRRPSDMSTNRGPEPANVFGSRKY
jgi:hypothetical protein